MGALKAVWDRITNKDLIEESKNEKIRNEREKEGGRLEMFEFVAKTSKGNAEELAEAGLPDRAAREREREEEARQGAQAIRQHSEVYGDDPLLDLLGGP